MLGRWPVHHLGDDTGSPAVADDVNDHLLVLEHPVPVGAAIDAHRRLVGADDARTAQSGQDRRDLVVEAGLGATEHGIQCAFADLQGKQVQEQPAQPLIADRVREAQIDRQRQDVHAERCARLQALGHRCQAHLLAARTMPGISLHPSYHRPNWWQINLVVKIVQHLIGIGQRSSAMHTAQRLGHDCRIGVAGQRPAATLPTQATLAWAVALRLLRSVGLLSLRWRQARIVRCLRRLGELRLQLGDTTLCRLKPLPQRQDQRILLGVAQLTEVG